MKIIIEKLSEKEIEKRGISKWPIWEKEISRFDWFYDSTEQCLLLTGKVIVETSSGEKYEFGKGDFVTFPQGLACIWDIIQPVKNITDFYK